MVIMGPQDFIPGSPWCLLLNVGDSFSLPCINHLRLKSLPSSRPVCNCSVAGLCKQSFIEDFLEDFKGLC